MLDAGDENFLRGFHNGVNTIYKWNDQTSNKERFKGIEGMDDSRPNPMRESGGKPPEHVGARQQRSAIEGGDNYTARPSHQGESGDPAQAMRERLDPLIQTTGEDGDGDEPQSEVEVEDPSRGIKIPVPDETGVGSTNGEGSIFGFHATHDNPGPDPDDPRNA